MKELSDVSEKFLMTHHKRHRTRVVKNTIDIKDSRGIISYPQIVFYKMEKTYKMRSKSSILSNEYHNRFMERMKKVLDDRE